MRINKFLARAGFASRRKAESLVIEGRVKVNGAVISDLSVTVGGGDMVTVDGRSVSQEPENIYIIMNKPCGCVTTCDDKFGRRTVMDIIGGIGTRVFPVGRLDYDTEGLLILTNDGDFTRRITHPSSRVVKTYSAKVDRPLSESDIKKLKSGVKITFSADNRNLAATVRKVTVNAENVRMSSNNDAEISIIEGRNRQVRKMFEAVGVKVLHLSRVSIGNLTLGNLKSGEFRRIKDLPGKVF